MMRGFARMKDKIHPQYHHIIKEHKA